MNKSMFYIKIARDIPSNYHQQKSVDKIKGKKMYSIFTSDLNKKNLKRVIENEVQKILNNPDILETIVRETVENDVEQYEMIFDSKEDVKNFEYMLT